MQRVRIFRPASFSTAEMRRIAGEADTDYTIIYTRATELRWVNFGLERMVQIADDTNAAMVYSDHFNGDEPAPVIDYQAGSLRDDFDFGGVQMYRTSVLKESAQGMDAEYEFAGLYDLRLRASRLGTLLHVNEFLYYELDSDKRDSGEKVFDSVKRHQCQSKAIYDIRHSKCWNECSDQHNHKIHHAISSRCKSFRD